MTVESCIVKFGDIVGKSDPEYIKKILGNNPVHLTIPGYQRQFDWEEHHFENVIEDTIDAMSNGSTEYYLGPIGIHDQGNSKLDIVDGQQRLTAVSLLCIALRDYCIENGFFRLANIIHEHAIYLDTNPRLESGLDPKKPRLNQNHTQLATLQHWPSGQTYRTYPPDESVMELIYSDKNGKDLVSGANEKVILCIDGWMKFPIGQSKEIWTFGNSTLEIEGKVDFEKLGDGMVHNSGIVEFEVIVQNHGPDDIQLGQTSDPLSFQIETDHDYLTNDHGGNAPDRRQRMFKIYKYLREEIKTHIEKNTARQDRLDTAGELFTMFVNYQFTVTLFDDLYDALGYFEKINDGTFSKPLNVRDIFNFRISELEQHAKDLSSRYDKTLKSPDTIQEHMQTIDALWSQVSEHLQPPEEKKKKDSAEVVAAFFQNYLLSQGTRRTSAKVLKTLVDETLKIPYVEPTPVNGVHVMMTFKNKVGPMSWFAMASGYFGPIVMSKTQSYRYVRLKHIDAIFTQGRSLLLSAFCEIRHAASTTLGIGIDFDDDGDYFTKAPDFFMLELKIISAIELHVARSIVLRHDDDPGFKGQDWHGAVDDWNTALAWRYPMTHAASDIDGVLDKIINGGASNISYDGKATKSLTLKGIKTMNATRTTNLIDAGTGKIDTSITEKRYSIKHGTFLLWIIECNLREAHKAHNTGWDMVDIKEDQSLEHILPQSCWKGKTLPITGWEWWDTAGVNVADKNDVRNYVERLGNMCIVKKKYNSSYSNKPFLVKQKDKLKIEADEYLSYSTLTSHWVTMSDIGLAKKSNTAVLEAMDCFDKSQFGLPPHHASLPCTEWTKAEIDNRNAWLFDCLQRILS
jgi:hypothetical protein